MGKFCSNCGKKIEECECKTSAKSTDVKNLFLGLLENLKGMFVKPNDTLKANVKEDNFIGSLIILGVNTLLAAFVSLVLAKELFGLIFGSLYTMISSSIPYFKVFMVTFFMVALLYAATIGLMYLVVNKLLKNKVSFKLMTSYYGIASIIMTPTLLVMILTALFSFKLTVIIFLAILMLKLFYLYDGIDMISKINKNRKSYILTAVVLVATLVVVLFMNLFL